MQKAVAAIAGCLALVLVIVLPSAVSTSEAMAACLPASVAVRGTVPVSSGLDAEQRANARTIVATVVARGMPTRAAVLAVAAALQESSLRNLPYGDLDSLGLFQQRPSQGWGSALEVMDPTRATDRFLDRLRDTPGWPVRPLTEVVQAVQNSGFPDAYARWERPAQAIVNALLGRPEPTVRDAGNDVPDDDRPISRKRKKVPNARVSQLMVETPIAPTAAGCDDGVLGYSSTPIDDCAFVLARQNPRDCQNAIRWALAQTDGPAVWYRRCLNFVAQAYGYSKSGVETAALYWATSPARIVGDLNPPAGALVFWDTGQPEGHVALSAGNGVVISNDIGGVGTITAVRLVDLTERWNATYLGWSPPFFPSGI